EKAVERLIEDIRELCEDFNDEKLSLETYQRRNRNLFTAIETARLAKMELVTSTTLQSSKMGQKLDAFLGLPPADTAAWEKRIGGALDNFRSLVASIPPDEVIVPTGNEVFDAAEVKAAERSRQAVQARLKELNTALDVKPMSSTRGVETVTIWKDKARTKRVQVPKLDVENLVEDFEASLCVQMKYSAPLVSQYVGPDITWCLDTKARYNEAAKGLIVKYRRLCLEYNSGIHAQEDYLERLAELMEAEKRAYGAREEMSQRLNERREVMREQLQELLGRDESPFEKEMREMQERKRGETKKKLNAKRKPSVVGQLSNKHREEMAAWDQFVESCGEVRIERPANAIEVWVDDARTKKIIASELDTDVIAESVKTRLSMHISFFDFGPEVGWAQDKGLDYGRSSQLLIVKSKKLCMDYNASLITQETYSRRSRQIDASIEKAAQVRSEMVEFYVELKDEMRKKLDFELKRQGGPARR
ncbi:MAG: hypothetical protein ACI841_005190, partial [Planctomycetota bacterium]